MATQFDDIYLCNKHTPTEYWSEDDNSKLIELKQELKDIKKKFVKDNEQFKHYESHYNWYEENITKLQKTTNTKLARLYNKVNQHEKKEIDNLVDMLNTKYDMTDVRVYLIVKEFLRNYIINNRIQKEMLSSTMIEHAFDSYGSKKTANVLIRSKLDYSRLYIDTIEKLDRMTKDDKIVESIVEDKSFYKHFLNSQPDRVIKVIDVKSE